MPRQTQLTLRMRKQVRGSFGGLPSLVSIQASIRKKGLTASTDGDITAQHKKAVVEAPRSCLEKTPHRIGSAIRVDLTQLSKCVAISDQF